MTTGVAETARTAVRGFGQLLITAGVVVLLFVAYELWITNLYTNNEQHALRNQLTQQWAEPTALVPPLHLGQGIALLFIPRLGRGYEKVIVEGVSEADLQKGPGHYPNTAMPGQVGNFVVSGHRTTFGAPFNRLDELRHGDPIIVETRTSYFTYDVTFIERVLPDDIAVIAPVPDQPGQAPTKRTLTFTTCDPKYSATHRLVVHGILVNARPRSQGPPPALAAAA